MTLSDTARARIDDVRELEPTSNGELKERWGMDSGSDVHRYLEDELGEYVTRDDDARIRVVGDAPQADVEGDHVGVAGTSGTSKREEDPQPSATDGGPSTTTTGASTDPSGRSDGPPETYTPEEVDEIVDTAVEAARGDSETSNPVAGGPAADPDPEPAQTDPEHPPEALDGCPQCGAELVDVRDATTIPVDGGQKFRVPDGVDYVCSECGQGFEWE